MKLIYKYWCTRCGAGGEAERHTDFSDINCNNCNSRAFGLIKYELIKKEEAPPVKKVAIREQPAIICPISKEWQLLNACEECDGYRGVYNQLTKDGKVPVAIKCAEDEY